jgi:hypothetical protein
MSALGERQSVLAAALDRLIPGGQGFPRPAELDLAATLIRAVSAERARVLCEGLDRITAATEDFAVLSAELQDDLLRQSEQRDPVFFTVLYETACYCYYADSAVLANLRRLGHDVNDAPLPAGYRMEAFDESLLPRSPRSERYIRTEDICRQMLPEGGPA